MGAFTSIFVSIVRSYLKPVPLVHPWGLPLPSIPHLTLSKEFVDSFDHILVVGDVHGCFDELVELLEKSNSSKPDTLKLFVGDVINKGPKSEEVLDFLMNNNTTCQSVRGNHDEVVLREYLRSRSPGYILAPQNCWIKKLSADQIHFLQELPYTISVPSLNAVVVHAGLVPGKGVEGTSIEEMVGMRDILFKDPWEEGGLQGTKKVVEGSVPWGSLWNGPAHVYFGHDAIRLMQRWPHCTGLDTGCVYGKDLTGIFIKGPRQGEVVSAKAHSVYQKPGVAAL
ncbi:serine/threonine-protein phosphatase 1-like [Ornithodoros turicata]|uniref:serine/threonine-protein phosphatase 1-like n=1 Tax=Ornithodoros turicata TaxID=34597 RepID=UPI0031396673